MQYSTPTTYMNQTYVHILESNSNVDDLDLDTEDSNINVVIEDSDLNIYVLAVVNASSFC